MGRSVSYPSDSIVTFRDCTDYDEFQFDDLIYDIVYQCQQEWPSFERVDKWRGREDHVLLENRHAQIGISEYCGLVSIWLVDSPSAERPELAIGFINQIADKFQKKFQQLRKLGHFSNGNAIYEKIGVNE